MNSESVPSLIERAESICRDHRLDVVEQWKKRTGGLAVGYMPIYVPRELFHAQGVLPVGIMGGGEDVEIIRGDAYYQSYICHIPRSTIELGLNGSLDCLDGMIFPAICDVIRNLSGVWKLEFPDKLSRYFDVPQNFGAIGGRFYRTELEDLSQELTARGARPYDAEALRGSLELYNGQRRLVDEAYELRRRAPWKVPTSELYVILRAGLLIPPEEFSTLLGDYLAAVRAEQSRTPMDQARVVLMGSFCEQPPLGLIKTLERSGCYIVDDDLVQVHRWIRSEIPLEGDPLDNLVQAFLRDSIDSPTRYVTGDEEKGRAAVERVQAAKAEGVLFCAPSFCDPALLDQPMAVRAMDRAGVPWTAFKYAENNGQFQVIREQAGTFADSIKLWSEV